MPTIYLKLPKPVFQVANQKYDTFRRKMRENLSKMVKEEGLKIKTRLVSNTDPKYQVLRLSIDDGTVDRYTIGGVDIIRLGMVDARAISKIRHKTKAPDGTVTVSQVPIWVLQETGTLDMSDESGVPESILAQIQEYHVFKPGQHKDNRPWGWIKTREGNIYASPVQKEKIAIVGKKRFPKKEMKKGLKAKKVFSTIINELSKDGPLREGFKIRGIEQIKISLQEAGLMRR